MKKLFWGKRNSWVLGIMLLTKLNGDFFFEKEKKKDL